jgi:hypothetical protein
MTVAISITEEDLLTALRGFLLPLIDGEVVQAQANRVPMPYGSFTTMTTLFLTGLSTNRASYTDTGLGTGTENNSRSTRWDVQLDFYGDGALDRAVAVSTLIRTDFACTWFKDHGDVIQPLYAGEPKQTSMVNGEQQYEQRWTVDFVAQLNPVVQTPMDFADQLNIGLAEVDATFPPEIQ